MLGAAVVVVSASEGADVCSGASLPQEEPASAITKMKEKVLIVIVKKRLK
jgi:hypothetical protein